MFEFFNKVLGLGPKVDFSALMSEGAQIVDVRSTDEFKSGHIKNSVNIPLHILSHKLSTIQKDKAVIVCCASGGRSAYAKQILVSNGFSQVHNGGGWRRLQAERVA